MIKMWPVKFMIAAALSVACGLLRAEPVMLTDGQMDQISAGGQYSIVSGGGFAESGTVAVQAHTSAMATHGFTLTRAVLMVKAAGSGLSAYGMGESGAGNAVAGVYGYATADQGKLKIMVRTSSMLRPDGGGLLFSMILVKASGSAALVTKSVTAF